MTTSQLLASFLAYRKSKGFKNHQVVHRQVEKLFSYLADNLLDVHTFTVHNAQQYQGWLLEQTYARGTVINFIKGARLFFTYLVKRKVVGANPFLELKSLRNEKTPLGHIYTEAEMNTLLTALSQFGTTGEYRLHVVCELLYATGCSIGEIAMLRTEQIDFDNQIIQFKTRTGFLHHYAKRVLQEYVVHRETALHHHHTHGLFFGSNTATLRRFVNDGLRAITKKLKLPFITCDGFRHAFGFHLYRAGCGLRFIQALMGYRQLHAVELYARMDTTALDTMLREYHPRRCDGE